MQGVSITLLIKTNNQSELSKVFYQDVYGLREKKYKYLEKNDINLTKWKNLKPSAPYYFFVPKDLSNEVNYYKFRGIPEIFHEFSSGIKTHRDHFLVAFKEEEIKQKMLTFTSDLPDELLKQGLCLKDTRDWKIRAARESTKKIDWNKNLRQYSYRPFDIRYICYLPDLIDRGCDRWQLMKNFFEKNLGIATIRSESKEVNFSHCFISNFIVDIHYSGGQTYVFPLYLYQVKDKKDLFINKEGIIEKKPNIILETFAFISDAYKKEPSPEEIFYYIYAILYSNIYRTKYAELLKIDFPRIPFTKDYKLFSKIFEYGKRLVDLHLLKSKELDMPVARFQGKGDNEVDKLRYDDKQKRFYFNRSQYFEGVTEEIWKYQIGSYQVCDKWLKDRKGRILNLGDIKHYCKVVTALKMTIEIQKEIDKLYPKIEEKIIEFKTDHL